MSMRCEDVRPLLAELVYEEVDPGVAEQLREHLGACLACRRYQNAFTAVRRDLQEWQPEAAPVRGGITFIAPGARPGTPIWRSRIFQGLAAAAGFVFVAVLLAAAVNFQVVSGPDGWTVSTTFGEPRITQEPGPATVSLAQIPELDSWFDARLDEQLGGRLDDRGVLTLASMPSQQFFTEGQVRELDRRFTSALDERFAERDLQITDRLESEFDTMRYYVDTSLEEHSNAFFYTLTNLVDGMEAEHRDQIFELTQYYSNLHADTDRRLEQTNFRVDSLLSIAAPSRSPEQ